VLLLNCNLGQGHCPSSAAQNKETTFPLAMRSQRTAVVSGQPDGWKGPAYGSEGIGECPVWLGVQTGRLNQNRGSLFLSLITEKADVSGMTPAGFCRTVPLSSHLRTAHFQFTIYTKFLSVYVNGESVTDRNSLLRRAAVGHGSAGLRLLLIESRGAFRQSSPFQSRRDEDLCETERRWPE
jgi:hypothetical protein